MSTENNTNEQHTKNLGRFDKRCIWMTIAVLIIWGLLPLKCQTVDKTMAEEPDLSNIVVYQNFSLLIDVDNVLEVMPFGGKNHVVWAGSKLHELCHGSLYAKSERDPNKTRVEYWISKNGREMQFYHSPMFVITKADWERVLSVLKYANKKDPDKIVQINLPFQFTNLQFKQEIAKRLNEKFHTSNISWEQITPAPLTKCIFHFGEESFPVENPYEGMVLSGKPGELYKKFVYDINGNLPIKVGCELGDSGFILHITLE